MLLVHRVLLTFLLSLLFLQSTLYAGKNSIEATSPVVPVPSLKYNSGFYIGIGSGWMRLKDDYTKEYFRTYPIMFQLGYRVNSYISLEARYIRDNSTVKYSRGNTNNRNYSDYPTIFSNRGLYLKASYPIDKFSFYTLLGYGKVSLTNIKGAKRYEKGFQWGGGLSYKLSKHLKVFADYTRVYSGKGFSGRAKLKNTHVDLAILGVSYAF